MALVRREARDQKPFVVDDSLDEEGHLSAAAWEIMRMALGMIKRLHEATPNEIDMCGLSQPGSRRRFRLWLDRGPNGAVASDGQGWQTAVR